MARDRDTDSGRFNEEYPDEDFLNAVDSLNFPSTKEIADYVGCSYTLAYHRLNSLADQDKLEKIEVGNSFAWSKYSSQV